MVVHAAIAEILDRWCARMDPRLRGDDGKNNDRSSN
jgi:hypothetical protein